MPQLPPESCQPALSQETRLMMRGDHPGRMPGLQGGVSQALASGGASLMGPPNCAALLPPAAALPGSRSRPSSWDTARMLQLIFGCPLGSSLISVTFTQTCAAVHAHNMGVGPYSVRERASRQVNAWLVCSRHAQLRLHASTAEGSPGCRRARRTPWPSPWPRPRPPC